jgi:hypothetical protein
MFKDSVTLAVKANVKTFPDVEKVPLKIAWFPAVLSRPGWTADCCHGQDFAHISIKLSIARIYAFRLGISSGSVLSIIDTRHQTFPFHDSIPNS